MKHENATVVRRCSSTKTPVLMKTPVLKRDSNTGVFPVKFERFYEHLFYRKHPVAASENTTVRGIFTIVSNIYDWTFGEISYRLKNVNNFTKGSIIDVWLGFEYASSEYK